MDGRDGVGLIGERHGGNAVAAAVATVVVSHGCTVRCDARNGRGMATRAQQDWSNQVGRCVVGLEGMLLAEHVPDPPPHHHHHPCVKTPPCLPFESEPLDDRDRRRQHNRCQLEAVVERCPADPADAGAGYRSVDPLDDLAVVCDMISEAGAAIEAPRPDLDAAGRDREACEPANERRAV